MQTPFHFLANGRGAYAGRAVAIACAALLVTACGSKTPPPVALMAVSTAAVSDAAGAGGVEHAPEEMRLARDKLDKAKRAMDAEDNDLAVKLAHEAQVDAQLAQGKAHAARATKAAAAVKEDGLVLQEELQRKAR